jgi:hypothetical protein
MISFAFPELLLCYRVTQAFAIATAEGCDARWAKLRIAGPKVSYGVVSLAGVWIVSIFRNEIVLRIGTFDYAFTECQNFDCIDAWRFFGS